MKESKPKFRLVCVDEDGLQVNDDGSSYAFIVLFSKEDATKAKKTNSLRMYRKHPNCKYLVQKRRYDE